MMACAPGAVKHKSPAPGNTPDGFLAKDCLDSASPNTAAFPLLVPLQFRCNSAGPATGNLLSTRQPNQ